MAYAGLDNPVNRRFDINCIAKAGIWVTHHRDINRDTDISTLIGHPGIGDRACIR